MFVTQVKPFLCAPTYADDEANSADDDDDIYGDEIALCLSHRLNHSCAPNVAWSFDSVKNVIEVNILLIKRNITLWF